MKTADWIVVSLGGSLIAPREGIDVEFLKKFHAFADGLVTEGRRLLIVTGGGQTARQYQDAAKGAGVVKDEDLDWLGVHATRLNAHLLRTLLRKTATPRIVTNPEEDELPDAKIIIAAGWKPGFSTDYDAAVLAKRLGCSRIVNLSNVDHVYSADPKKDPHARRYDRMTWKEFRALVGNEWKPGLNAPFDPVAARLCDEAGIEVAILSGKNLANARRALLGKEFEGTLIR